MKALPHFLTYTMSVILLVALVFSSGALSVLLYAKITGKAWAFDYSPGDTAAFAQTAAATAPPPASRPSATPIPVKKSAMLEAPLVMQNPELPSGCEISSLTMLLQFGAVYKNKMEILLDMKFDPTELKRKPDGGIAFWGNPNDGFVGDISGKAKGFGIFHSALLDLLQKHKKGGIDLTGRPFEAIEKQIADGVPVVVWTTIDYIEPSVWVEWDSPTGRVRTTFAEHAVLMVGYDEGSVYVNDPLSGKRSVKIPKEQFVKTWENMGKQAISYAKD